jgi:hypothetical protein
MEQQVLMNSVQATWVHTLVFLLMVMTRENLYVQSVWPHQSAAQQLRETDWQLLIRVDRCIPNGRGEGELFSVNVRNPPMPIIA